MSCTQHGLHQFTDFKTRTKARRKDIAMLHAVCMQALSYLSVKPENCFTSCQLICLSCDSKGDTREGGGPSCWWPCCFCRLVTLMKKSLCVCVCAVTLGYPVSAVTKWKHPPGTNAASDGLFLSVISFCSAEKCLNSEAFYTGERRVSVTLKFTKVFKTFEKMEIKKRFSSPLIVGLDVRILHWFSLSKEWVFVHKAGSLMIQ